MSTPSLYFYIQYLNKIITVFVQSLSYVQLFVTPRTVACQVSLSFTISQSLLKLMSIEWVMPTHPLSSPSPPALNLSQLWLFASGGQSIRAPPSASVLPMNIHGWFPLGLTGLISLLSKELSRVFSSNTVQKH